MPCAQGRTGSDRSAQARGSAVPGLRRGRVEGSPFRRIQAVHENGRPVPARPPAAARLRLEAARPHCPGPGRAMVRPVQPDRSRQCQSRARASHADHQLRDRPRSPRNQPGAGRGKEPETDAHTLSVPRRGRSAPSRPGQADPRQQARAGGHHPAPASDRMPQERDPSAALVGSRSRQAGPRRRQDGPQDRSPQYPGPAHSRTPAARRKPVRLSVPERSRPAPQPKSSVLVPRPARGGHRGRSPSRSPPLPCQPRCDERRAGSGRC